MTGSVLVGGGIRLSGRKRMASNPAFLAAEGFSGPLQVPWRHVFCLAQ